MGARPGRDALTAGHPDAADDAARLGAFSALLALALVFHVLWWHGVAVDSPWFVVVATAFWALARPASVGRLALLLGAAAVAIVAELPALGTHLLLVLAIAACTLVELVVGLVRDRRLPSPGALFGRLAPFLRAATLVLYAAAVLSKLNDTWFDASASPAIDLSAKVVWFDPDLLAGAWHVLPAIWGSLLIEASLPLLLAVRRTRTVGLVLGLGFHAALALSGTVPFTALMLALYVGFLPAGTRWSRFAGPRTVVVPPGAGGVGPGSLVAGGSRRDLIAVVAVASWLLLAGVATVDPGRVTGGVLASATRILVAGAALAAAVAVVRWARAGAGPAATDGGGPVVRPGTTVAERGGSRSVAGAPRSSARGPRGVFAVGVVALVLVAASPYLGHRAGDAFTMYSGLRTAEGSWNHLVVPQAVRVLH